MLGGRYKSTWAIFNGEAWYMPGKEGSLGKLDSLREAITAAHTQHFSAAQLGQRGILPVACALVGAQ